MGGASQTRSRAAKMAKSPWRFTARMKGECLSRSKTTTETRPFGVIRIRTREERASSADLVRRCGAGLRRQEERV